MSFHNRTALIILPLHPECFEFDLISIYIWARTHTLLMGQLFEYKLRNGCASTAACVRVCIGWEKDEQK